MPKLEPNSLFSNSAHWVAARFLSGVSRIGVLLLIARIYGPKTFGEISLAIALTEIFRTISECGLDTIAIRKFRQSPESEKRDLLGIIVGTKLLLAAVAYAVVILGLWEFARSKEVEVLGAVAGLSLFSANFLGAFTSYFQSRLAMSQVFWTTLNSVGFLALWTALCLGAGWPIPLVLLGLPVAEGINAGQLWLRSRESIRVKFQRKEILELLGQSLPVGLMGAMIILYLRLDNFFVYRFSGEVALGLYSVAYRSVEPFLMIPHSFSMTLYSHLSGQTGSTSDTKVTFRNVLDVMWPSYVFAVAAMAGVIMGGKFFLTHFFPRYAPIFPVMRILAFLLLIRTANITLTAVLCSYGKYQALAKITATNLLANLIFASALIPYYGPWGAGLAALLTESWNCAAQWRCLSACVSSMTDQQSFARVEAEAK